MDPKSFKWILQIVTNLIVVIQILSPWKSTPVFFFVLRQSQVGGKEFQETYYWQYSWEIDEKN